jgi:hypothetical protein
MSEYLLLSEHVPQQYIKESFHRDHYAVWLWLPGLHERRQVLVEVSI